MVRIIPYKKVRKYFNVPYFMVR